MKIFLLVVAFIAAATAGDDCRRYGPDVAIPIIVTYHGDLGPQIWRDTVVEYRDCGGNYMVKRPGEPWVSLQKSRYHVEVEDVNEKISAVER